MTFKLVANKKILLELFIISNLFFLTFDILIAHAMNKFEHNGEYIPLYFSIISSAFLFVFFVFKNKFEFLSKNLNIVIGIISILVGLLGFYYHLDSRLLKEFNIKNMVYTAPLVAPLSYTGIGIVLVVNSIYDSKTDIWIKAILFCGWTGFVGNFILSLADHAQNGFFHISEWVPVISSAIAVGVFFPLFIYKPTKNLLLGCNIALVLQFIIGIMGFILHFEANINATGTNIGENFIYGAPIFAPLLFINLSILLLFPLSSFWKKNNQEFL